MDLMPCIVGMASNCVAATTCQNGGRLGRGLPSHREGSVELASSQAAANIKENSQSASSPKPLATVKEEGKAAGKKLLLSRCSQVFDVMFSKAFSRLYKPI